MQLEERYGAKTLYEGGLVIKTGLDPALQRAAHQALDGGLRRLDKARGFRKPARNVIEEKRTIESFRHPRWSREIATGDIVPALVTDVEGAREFLRRQTR